MAKSSADHSAANDQLTRDLNDVLAKKGITAERAAALMNIPAARMRKYCNPEIPNPFPAYLLASFSRLIGSEILEGICYDAGRGSAELPKELPEWDDAIELGAQIMRECSVVLDMLAKSVKEQHMTHREYLEMKRAIEKGMSAMLGVRMVTSQIVTVVPRAGGTP